MTRSVHRHRLQQGLHSALHPCSQSAVAAFKGGRRAEGEVCVLAKNSLKITRLFVFGVKCEFSVCFAQHVCLCVTLHSSSLLSPPPPSPPLRRETPAWGEALNLNLFNCGELLGSVQPWRAPTSPRLVYCKVFLITRPSLRSLSASEVSTIIPTTENQRILPPPPPSSSSSCCTFTSLIAQRSPCHLWRN